MRWSALHPRTTMYSPVCVVSTPFGWSQHLDFWEGVETHFGCVETHFVGVEIHFGSVRAMLLVLYHR